MTSDTRTDLINAKLRTLGGKISFIWVSPRPIYWLFCDTKLSVIYVTLIYHTWRQFVFFQAVYWPLHKSTKVSRFSLFDQPIGDGRSVPETCQTGLQLIEPGNALRKPKMQLSVVLMMKSFLVYQYRVCWSLVVSLIPKETWNSTESWIQTFFFKTNTE